ncbi:MAG: cytochrome c oxidase subunit 3, partial [Deltaproteobacteria bacterium]|nr:cytochrome c oxidase subunit 3 [Deltaproteobacteria bacterium]
MEDKIAKIGMTFFVATEIMFFAGLISAYWVLRSQVVPWPPVGQPRLPAMMTGLNTLVLLFSAVSIGLAEHALRRLKLAQFITWLQVTAAAGLLFLAVQGYEWERLIRFGMRTTKNIYGGLFYIIIGAHAV